MSTMKVVHCAHKYNRYIRFIDELDKQSFERDSHS